MRRSRCAPLVLALAFVPGVAACGGGGQQPAAEQAAPIPNPVDPATAGTVAGAVTFEGTPPAPQRISMNSDPNCANPSAVTETVVVNGSALQNVFLYVKDGLGDLRFPVPSTPVVLDQQGCRYTPHVLGVQVGQPLEILNSDATLHNVHALPRANQEFNTGQPIKGMRHTHTFSATEVMVPFKCDVHGWMNAYVGALPHPFFAVSAADGRFELKGLPPGTYTVEAWHEKLGTQTQVVTVAAKETAAVSFTFKG